MYKGCVIPFVMLYSVISKIANAGKGLFSKKHLKKNEFAYVPFFGDVLEFSNANAVKKFIGDKKKRNRDIGYLVDTKDPLRKIDATTSIAGKANMSTCVEIRNNATICYFDEEDMASLTEEENIELRKYEGASTFLKKHHDIFTFLQIQGPLKKNQEIFCDYNPGIFRRFKTSGPKKAAPMKKQSARKMSLQHNKLAQDGRKFKKDKAAKLKENMIRLRELKAAKLVSTFYLF